MNIALLAPLGLAALAALALPILIHLARRSELAATDFAALRWISERVRPRRRVRIERPWLLLLRLLLLALLAVLLARPVLLREGSAVGAYVVVAPGVERAAARSAVPASGADWHWLTPGFPPLDGASAAAADAPLASLLRELDARLPPSTRLIAIVPRQVAGLDGERLRLAHAVEWQVVAGEMPVTESTQTNDDARPLSVRYAKSDDPALAYLRAAVAAWNTRAPGRFTLDAAPAGTAIPAAARWLVWLDAAPAPTSWVERGRTVVVENGEAVDGTPLWRDVDGRVVAREMAVGRGRKIALAAALTPAAMPMLLDADFPDRLRRALAGAAAPPTRATAAAARPLQASVPALDPPRDPSRTLNEDGVLVVLVALLFAIERVVATRRRAEPGA